MAKKMPGKPVKPKRDGSVEELTHAIEGVSSADLFHNSYLSRSTIDKLRSGRTRMPQNMTMRGIASAVGLEYVLRRKR